MKTIALVLAAALAVAYAECPNGCSGHGTCGVHDSCSCYDNWQGGDCSQRVCPFGLAFVDTPVGDLNHDGSVSANSAVGAQFSNKNVNEVWQGSSSDEAHFYAECSGKGSCDRAAGSCECFDGYTGSSCQRTTCPNDCSGQGQCFSLREIAAGVNPTVNYHPKDGTTEVGRNFRVEDYAYGTYETSGVSTVFDYNLWDADKGSACVCDAGFFGIDCSMRDCPRGNDPLTTDIKYCGGASCTNEAQYMYIGAQQGTESIKMFFTWRDQENHAGLLRAVRSSSFTLKGGLTGDDYAELVQDTLESFPNSLLNGVSVTCMGMTDNSASPTTAMLPAHTQCSTAFANTAAASLDSFVVLKIDFNNGPQGNVYDLMPVLIHQYSDATPVALDYASTTHLAVGIESRAAGGGSNVFNSWTEGLASYSAINPPFSAISMPGVTNAGADLLNAASSLIASYYTTPTPSNGNHENSPCSNRGVCDFSAGTCSCFSGYTREDCSVQSALAM